MAVARPELTVAEIDWVVETLKATKVPRERRRAVRELERAQERAHALQRAELAHVRKVRRAADENRRAAEARQS